MIEERQGSHRRFLAGRESESSLTKHTVEKSRRDVCCSVPSKSHHDPAAETQSTQAHPTLTHLHAHRLQSGENLPGMVV